MRSEKYKKCIPIKDIPDTLVLFGLHDNYEGFRILLRDGKSSRVLRIRFDSFFTYRNTDIGYLSRTMLEKNKFVKWPLFTVKNSMFLQCLQEENPEKQLNEKPVHYAIITPNNCIDVISESSPKVEWLCEYNDEE
jgi:hypothetical protein